MSNLSLPCPNPHRDGTHETYLLKGRLVCKACGGQEEDQRLPNNAKLLLIHKFYEDASRLLIALGRDTSKKEALKALESLMHRSDVQQAIDEFDVGALRYSPCNGGMMMTPRDYKQWRGPVGGDKASKSGEDLYSRLRFLARTYGGEGICHPGSKSEVFPLPNSVAGGAIAFVEALRGLKFESVKAEVDAHCISVSWT